MRASQKKKAVPASASPTALVALLDRPDRLDEHAAVLGDRLAVGRAGVVDEARGVAIHPGVDDGAPVDDEQEGVVVVDRLQVVAAVGLLVRDALAEVLDHPRALADALQREDTESVHGRIAHLDERRAAATLDRPDHTATGATIPASCW